MLNIAHVTLGSGRNLFQEQCSSQRFALNTCSIKLMLSDLHFMVCTQALQRVQGLLADTTDGARKEHIEATKQSLPGP